MTELSTLTRDYQNAQDSVANRVLSWLLKWWVGEAQGNLGNPNQLFESYRREVERGRRESIQLAQNFHNTVRNSAGLGSLPPSQWGGVRASDGVNDAFYSAVAPARKRLDDPDFVAELDRLIYGPLRENTDRVTLAGGRDALANARESDREVIGYYRKAEADPCGFCAMLASRGLVYTESRNSDRRSRSYLDEQNPEKYHENCRCQTLPLFEGLSMPAEDRERADRWLAQWKETDGSGAEQLSNFRKQFRSEES
ncbi:hypothetical protein CPT_Shady_003 [Streptomyces phage Shady]|uniref:Capsid maturation protease n=1 Tax=Streptomyces phage Shady TaxID=2767585 RepID=A0A873WVR3_9CAUD|nr:hypothetical protein CPT_Shady_003 [Streptomyces phage Shady]